MEALAGVLVLVVLVALLGMGGGGVALAALIVVGVIAYGYVAAKEQAEKAQAERDAANAALSQALQDANFAETQRLLGIDAVNAVAVDEQSERVFFATLKPGPSHSIHAFGDVLSVELFEDGDLITHTERSSQLAGAAVGGMLLGGAGAVVGGLSGKTKTTKNVKRVEVRLHVNDLNHPTFSVVLLGDEMQRTDPRYTEARRTGEQWAALLGAVVHRGEVATAHAAPAASLPKGSVADELQKLAGLRDAGVLTEDEFQRQKAKALG